jgi:hypothetical protein
MHLSLPWLDQASAYPFFSAFPYPLVDQVFVLSLLLGGMVNSSFSLLQKAKKPF